MRLTALLLILAASPAFASSEGAWDEFRAKVEDACAALAPDEGSETVIEVNPFGSESYGAALLITSHADGSADRYVCIYDKRAGTAELTAPFTPPAEVTEIEATPSGEIGAVPSEKTDAHLVGDGTGKGN